MHNNIDDPIDSEESIEQLEQPGAAGLLQVGAACGDDEGLLLAKAARLHDLLREILEGTPLLQLTAVLPAGLSAEQREFVTGAIRDAASAGMRVAAGHAAASLAGAMYDLCTSRLRQVMH